MKYCIEDNLITLQLHTNAITVNHREWWDEPVLLSRQKNTTSEFHSCTWAEQKVEGKQSRSHSRAIGFLTLWLVHVKCWEQHDQSRTAKHATVTNKSGSVGWLSNKIRSLSHDWRDHLSYRLTKKHYTFTPTGREVSWSLVHAVNTKIYYLNALLVIKNPSNCTTGIFVF